MINTLLLQLSNLLLLLSFSRRKHTSMASHPQYLSGLSRTPFPSIFLEIAVDNELLACVKDEIKVVTSQTAEELLQMTARIAVFYWRVEYELDWSHRHAIVVTNLQPVACRAGVFCFVFCFNESATLIAAAITKATGKLMEERRVRTNLAPRLFWPIKLSLGIFFWLAPTLCQYNI